MSDTVAGLLQIGSVLLLLGLIWKPLGDYLAWTYSSPQHWRVEKAVYRMVGVDADADQRWPVYLRGLLSFSVVSILGLYLLQRVQQWLPLDQGMAAVPSDIAFNTAALHDAR